MVLSLSLVSPARSKETLPLSIFLLCSLFRLPLSLSCFLLSLQRKSVSMACPCLYEVLLMDLSLSCLSCSLKGALPYSYKDLGELLLGYFLGKQFARRECRSARHWASR
jgi:hypothetical protein